MFLNTLIFISTKNDILLENPNMMIKSGNSYRYNIIKFTDHIQILPIVLLMIFRVGKKILVQNPIWESQITFTCLFCLLLSGIFPQSFCLLCT